MGMQMHFTNPDIQAKLEQWATDTGRPAEELVEDVMAGYFDELAQVRQTLDSRYDDIKSGKVKLIPGDEVIARLRERSAAFRRRQA
jgi:hypothetical protein